MFRNQAGRSFEETVFNYQDGITDHVKELAGEDALTPVQSWQAEKKVRDRADKPEYKCKINVALTFSNKMQRSGILSQLQLAGARRRAGKGSAKRLCLPDRQLFEAERENTIKMRAKSPFRT